MKKFQIAVGVLLAFYIVGLIGIGIPALRGLTVALTPLNLLVTLGLFVWVNGQYDRSFVRTMSIVYLIGYGVEVAGVNTGMLFGDYYYGTALGFQVYNVPLLIGVNWCLLSFATCGIAKGLVEPVWGQVLIATVLMVGLDVVIEPIAVELDFWNWVALPEAGVVPEKNFAIPLQNYVMWFLVGLGINSLILNSINQIHFKLAIFIFGLQLGFFGLLNILLP